jgi:hypothetical protein
MRPRIIAGIVLIVLAAVLLLKGGSFTTRENVLELGDLTVSADERQQIPTWVSALGLVAGIVLVGTGLKQKG